MATDLKTPINKPEPTAKTMTRDFALHQYFPFSYGKGNYMESGLCIIKTSLAQAKAKIDEARVCDDRPHIQIASMKCAERTLKKSLDALRHMIERAEEAQHQMEV